MEDKTSKKKKKKKGERKSMFSKKKAGDKPKEEAELGEDGLPKTRLRSATQASIDELTDEELQALHDFRDSYLNVIQFVQKNRGRRHIEGNPDFLWAIPTEVIKKHILLKVLSRKMREFFATELELRERFPEIQQRIKRNIRGIPSYDFYANEEYIESFAMETKSLKNYLRGKIQVSGEDYALAHAGVWNWFKRYFCGVANESLDVVFPEIRDELSGVAERHTTAIGIDPTKVAGPRFVLNIRVPPAPPGLVPLKPGAHAHQPITDMNDPNYDEWEENWQYLRITVKDVFSYRIRLPKGLQYKKIPEIQVEIPCVEQNRSTHKTVLIGGVRVATGGAAAELSQQHAKEVTNGEKSRASIDALMNPGKAGPGKHKVIETTLTNIASPSMAEKADKDRAAKKKVKVYQLLITPYL